MHYELSHLVQDPSQAVFGPIQDDEALLLFALCRVTCARRIAEFGGESGYSARNFLAAIWHWPEGRVYSVDANPVPVLSPKHRFIHKLAKDVLPADFDNLPLDLIFFDCHDFAQQLQAFHTLCQGGVILRNTYIAMHDTGPHPKKLLPWSFRGEDGYIHQVPERELVNHLQDLGYDCLSFHAPQPVPPLQFRHGLTLCRARHRLANHNFDVPPMTRRGAPIGPESGPRMA